MNRRNAIGGVLIGLGAVTGIAGYKWYDWSKTPDLNYLASKETLLDALAGTIIPATDSPGAGDNGTGRYIITMIRDCMNKRGQNRFIDGLKELEEFSTVHFNKTYQECTPAEQFRIMKNFENQGRSLPGIAGKAQEKFIGMSFFHTLRAHTVKGYCTSKNGATIALQYIPVPGRYTGMMPIQPNQRSWATK